MTTLARLLGVGTVAEGVETLAELNCVTNAGCDEVQGYHFSSAIPNSELMATLAECEHRLRVAS